MAYLSRVIALLLLVFAGSSFAGPRDYYFYASSPWWPTAEEGCASVSPPTPNHVFSHVYIPPGYGDAYWQCFFADTTIPPPNTAQHGGGMKGTCPDGTIADYSAKACITPSPCDEGETRNTETGLCEKPCPSAGSPAGSWNLDSKSITSVCNDGCRVVRVGEPTGFGYGGSMVWQTNFVYSGATCTPGELPGTDGTSPGDGGLGTPEPTPPEDKQCHDKGLCPFNYNGKILCTKCDSKEGTTNESGSSSGSGTDSSGNSTGDTGTTNTTKETTANCTNGSCNTTTTTTVTYPDGSTTTTTESQSAPQADFCKSNPGHIVCKGEDEGTFGGSCASGFQCSGDAVQCAQAEAAWKSACAADVSGMSDQINTGSAAMAAGAASGLGIPGGSDVFDLGSRLSEVPLFGSSGGCPSDVSVNVGGTSYTIAFSAMCGQLQVLGVALMGFAYLIAGFIVFRGDRS